jgi:hypothetical protein
MDGQRNLYILDRGNMRVRAVNLYNAAPYSICGRTIAQGNVDTILGTGVITGSIDGEGPTSNPDDELGDGGACTAATVTELKNIAIDRSKGTRGVLYVSDAQNFRVRAVNLNTTGDVTVAGVTIAPGEIETVVGTGVRIGQIDGPFGTNLTDDFIPGFPANQVAINRPGPLAVDSRGMLVVIDTELNVVLAVNTTTATLDLAGIEVGAGAIQVVGGDFFAGARGFNGDGIPALDALFDEPNFVAVGPFRDGTNIEIFVSDRMQERIRVISSQGIINTWAGTGVAGYNGEGVPPVNALVNEPAGLAMYTEASTSRRFLYYVDARNKMVRRQVR